MNNFYKGGRGMACGHSDETCQDPPKHKKLQRLKPIAYGLLLLKPAIKGHRLVMRGRHLFKILKSLKLIAYSLLILNFMLFSLSDAWAQSGRTLFGVVRSAAEGQPLEGVSIRVGKQQTTTNKQGKFQLRTDQQEGTLEIKYLGYTTQSVPFHTQSTVFDIQLEADDNYIEEVEVVSTGYQQIPKERATGSFVQIDNELLNRRVGLNILDRLDGITSGVIFNRNNQMFGNNSAISIRGRSTLFGNPEPLIVVDNFPYEGSLESINPADVENITILKDAAAASIWGVRAGNGVIVINTKTGGKTTNPVVNFTSNLTFSTPRDVFQFPWVSSSDYIDLEKELFDNGYYNNVIQNEFQPISQAIEIFWKEREGVISEAQSRHAIDELKMVDVRKDLKKYFLQNPFNQQYQLNISGGGDHSRYFISGAIDNNRYEQVSNKQNRKTLYVNNSYALFDKRLTLHSGIQYNSGRHSTNSMYYNPYTPYDQVVDQNGGALEVGKYLRPSYTDIVANHQLLDWKYRPLHENSANTYANTTDLRMNIKSDFLLTKFLNLSLNYQYQYGNTENRAINTKESYYTRNYINTYSSIDDNGNVNRIVPLGDIVQTTATLNHVHNGRVQLNFDHSFSNHEIQALAGVELRRLHRNTDNQILYGVDQSIAVNANAGIDPTRYYTNYYSGSAELIPVAPVQSYLNDRFRSYFALASWTISKKYTVTGSARRDESNLFGVKSNQRGVPLWSVGGIWNIAAEPFLEKDWIDAFRVKATYGYNGNIDKSTSAYLTAQLTPQLTPWLIRPREIVNPPNPSLRWEKIRNINLGIDFSLYSNRLTGSMDIYRKYGLDLIGNSRLAPQTGAGVFTGNSANMKTKGVDIVLGYSWLQKSFYWKTDVLYNINHDQVTEYKLDYGTNFDIVTRNYRNPIVGFPYNAMFSYAWQGLDSKGDPQGLLNGEVSQDYTGILNAMDNNQLVYHGSAAPTHFGSVRNTLGWKNWLFSFNIVFNAGYYIRKTSVFSGANFNFRQTDFENRWQRPGDESWTDIPALVYPSNNARGVFFENSSALVMRGDHLRFQDFRLSYKLSISNGIDADLYSYVNNIGLIWKSNDHNLDPDYGYVRQPLNVSVGINLKIK